jgi:O-antigen/teichoic acid export membrane protein
MTQGASSLLVSADKQRSILMLVIIIGLIKLGLDALLIHHFGLTGAVVAFLTTATINASCYVTLAVRVSHAQPDWAKLLRIFLAAGLAALIAWPLRGLLPLASVLAGGMVLVIAYAPLSLLLGCWDREDIEHLQHLHQRFAQGRPRLGARLLAWAHARAPGEGGT